MSELVYKLLVALAVGLLIGIERGWTLRGESEGERTFGLRTLALAGLLGGTWGAIAQALDSAAVLAAAFLVFGIATAAYRLREMQHDGTFGATTLLAGLLAFSLGAMAVVGDTAAAAAGGVVTAGLLALKPSLHAWLQRITEAELRHGLLLAAMALVLLPLLPDRAMGPYDAVNPHELWQMTVLIAAVSTVGYVAVRTFGSRGVLLSGLAGGLVSSTAVTASFARLARDEPAHAPILVAGILVACATMVVRILVVVSVFNAGLLTWLAPPLIVAAIVLAAYAGALAWHGEARGEAAEIGLKTPFELAEVLKFGALLAVIVVASHVATRLAGAAGALTVAALSGIADVDAVTLSMTRLAGTAVAPLTAVDAILIAAGVNSISKLVIGWTAGGAAVGRHLAAATALAIALAVVALLLVR